MYWDILYFLTRVDIIDNAVDFEIFVGFEPFVEVEPFVEIGAFENIVKFEDIVNTALIF